MLNPIAARRLRRVCRRIAAKDGIKNVKEAKRAKRASPLELAFLSSRAALHFSLCTVVAVPAQ
jgi:hypothetical protein